MLPHPDSGLNPYYEEPCFLTPEDDPSMLDPHRELPPGPMWWLGLWPEGGIATLEDLEKYVEDRLTDTIRLNWAEPEVLGDLGLDLGRQAVTNAISYLVRFGQGDPPRRPTGDELKSLDGVQVALESLLLYLRREREKGVPAMKVVSVGAGSGGGDLQVAGALAVPAAVEAATPDESSTPDAAPAATVTQKTTGRSTGACRPWKRPGWSGFNDRHAGIPS